MATLTYIHLHKIKMIILGRETMYLIIESSSFRPLIFDSSSLHSTDVHFFDTKSFSFFRWKQKLNFYNIIFLIIVEYKSNQWNSRFGCDSVFSFHLLPFLMIIVFGFIYIKYTEWFLRWISFCIYQIKSLD